MLCAAGKGTVPLADFAFKPRKLDRQFRKKIKAVVNDFRFVRVFAKSSRLLLIEDFKKSQTEFLWHDFLSFINKYRQQPLPLDCVVEFYPGNRNLNIKN